MRSSRWPRRGWPRCAWLLPAVLLAVHAGCRRDPYLDTYLENLHLEKLTLEDRIWEMEYEQQALHSQVAALRHKLQLPGDDGSGKSLGSKQVPRAPTRPRATPAPTTPQRTPRPNARPARKSPPADDDAFPAGDDLRIEPGGDGSNTAPPSGEDDEDGVRLEMPSGETNQGEIPPPDDERDATPPEPGEAEEVEASRVNPRSAAQGKASRGSRAAVRQPAAEATHLFINPLLTGGQDFDRRPGDDGLRVVIEPRDDQERFVAEVGQVSIVALDPRQRELGRDPVVGQWQFDLSEVRKHMVSSGIRRGIHLRMPWPDSPPESPALELQVTLTPRGGQTLKVEREVHVDLGEGGVASWTPRSAPDSRQTEGSRSGIASRPADHSPPRSPPRQARRSRPEWSPTR